MRTDQVLLLLALWAAYFTLHSLFASLAAKAWVAQRWPGWLARYRLIYNLTALITLVPPALATYAWAGPLLWHWGPFQWLADAFAGLAVVAVVIAPTGYDLRRFLGLGGRAAMDGGLAGEGLRLSGVHRYVRHPWYCGALILIWTRPMDLATLLSAGAITSYLLLGSRLEESKLIAEYGDAYRDYRRRVPALFPWPCRALSVADARRLEQQAHADRAAKDGDGATTAE